MVVFVVFGIYSLHARFRRLNEWSMKTQIAVLLLIALFYFIEISALRVVLWGNPVFLIFSTLGLFVAGLALYGHILVSVLSRMLLGVVSPEETGISDRPRLGPAEALEHHGDYENALNEYYVLARIYPDNPLISLRIATNLERLSRHEDALVWMERAFKNSHSPEDGLILIRRIADLATDRLHKPERLRQAQAQFVRRFPSHAATEGLRRELETTCMMPPRQVASTSFVTRKASLVDSLEEAPLTDAAESEDRKILSVPPSLELVRLEDAPCQPLEEE